jgi:hypothetical protein
MPMLLPPLLLLLLLLPTHDDSRTQELPEIALFFVNFN